MGEAVEQTARMKVPACETDQGGEKRARRARVPAPEGENQGEERQQGNKRPAYGTAT